MEYRTHKEPDGSWTATAFYQGQWWGQLKGFHSRSTALRAIKEKY